MKTWLDPLPISVPDALAAAIGGHPLVAATLARRGLTDLAAARAFLDPAAYTPAAPSALPGVSAAADRLVRALAAAEPICVWGDFDVDGQTATTVLVATLRDLARSGRSLTEPPCSGRSPTEPPCSGRSPTEPPRSGRSPTEPGIGATALGRRPARATIDCSGRSLTEPAPITYHIPIRATESHGVNLPVLQQVIAAGARLILTCDTGIAAHEAVTYTRSQGVDVIITDHHDLPPTLPDACAIVSPKLLPADHPLRDLPGVGVAYKLAEELYRRAGRPEAAARLLDLVALGIVADVAVQRADTRYLLQRGLAVLRGAERLGLRVLMQTAELALANLTEEHIGFVLAPRLNALGRLADANPIVEFLTLPSPGSGRSPDRATSVRIMASELEALNARRQLMCDQVTRAAEAQIARDPSLLDAAALVLAGASWPAGIIGIVASRLVGRYGRPVVLIAAPPGEIARGSARSVAGCNITAAIATHADLLASFGGHPMAAGLSLAPERIPEFRRGLARTVAAMLADAPPAGGLALDGVLPLADLTLDLVADLERLAPFGPGNPALTLVSRGLTVRGSRKVGRNGEHLLVYLADAAGHERKAIWWDGGGETLPVGRFDLAYAVRASDYGGQRELQIEWLDWQPVAGAAPIEPSRPTIAVVDYRGQAQPRALLENLRSQGPVIVWREGPAAADLDGCDRTNLLRGEALAIWTAPPGPAELAAALAAVAPATIYLFGLDPGMDAADAFLRRLAGLVKHALRARAGRVSVATLAAATAQREAAVYLGLAWLAERGHIAITAQAGDALTLAPGAQAGGDAAATFARLSDLLIETAAYRAYFAAADGNRLAQSQGFVI